MLAYANWLAAQTGRPYRLPTEAEWERAARHTDGRIYPWGDDWRDGLVNSEEAGIGHVTAVGLFPSGAAACGALDMSGNVWEWCQTRWNNQDKEDYPQPWADDGRENQDGSASFRRVLRGCSYGYNKDYQRCAVRSSRDPYYRYYNVGFRLVLSPFISDL